MEKAVEQGADSRRLFVTALSVLAQIVNCHEPSPDDVRFLKANALADESDMDIDELAASIIRRESDRSAAQRKIA